MRCLLAAGACNSAGAQSGPIRLLHARALPAEADRHFFQNPGCALRKRHPAVHPGGWNFKQLGDF